MSSSISRSIIYLSICLPITENTKQTRLYSSNWLLGRHFIYGSPKAHPSFQIWTLESVHGKMFNCFAEQISIGTENVDQGMSECGARRELSCFLLTTHLHKSTHLVYMQLIGRLVVVNFVDKYSTFSPLHFISLLAKMPLPKMVWAIWGLFSPVLNWEIYVLFENYTIDSALARIDTNISYFIAILWVLFMAARSPPRGTLHIYNPSFFSPPNILTFRSSWTSFFKIFFANQTIFEI